MFPTNLISFVSLFYLITKPYNIAQRLIRSRHKNDARIESNQRASNNLLSEESTESMFLRFPVPFKSERRPIRFIYKFIFPPRMCLLRSFFSLTIIKDALHLHSQPKVQYNENFTTSQHDKYLKEINRIEDIKDFNPA